VHSGAAPAAARCRFGSGKAAAQTSAAGGIFRLGDCFYWQNIFARRRKM